MSRNRVRSTAAWKRLARNVVASAKQNGTPCFRCGVPIQPDDKVDADHIVSLMDGGQVLNPANVRASHASCNRSHGASEGNRRRGVTTSAPPPRSRPRPPRRPPDEPPVFAYAVPAGEWWPQADYGQDPS